MQTGTYRMDKQQGAILYSTGNYIQYPVIKPYEKEYEKDCVCVCVCVCVTESLCYRAVSDTTL